MTTIRTSRQKGSQHELDCYYNLKSLYPDLERCGGIGMVQGYDLISHNHKIVVECKRLKGISWNQVADFYALLCLRAPMGYTPFVLFQSNRQPCLVMKTYHTDKEAYLAIKQFWTQFGIPFVRGKRV